VGRGPVTNRIGPQTLAIARPERSMGPSGLATNTSKLPISRVALTQKLFSSQVRTIFLSLRHGAFLRHCGVADFRHKPDGVARHSGAQAWRPWHPRSHERRMDRASRSQWLRWRFMRLSLSDPETRLNRLMRLGSTGTGGSISWRPFERERVTLW
jgi:hypothetical protein